MQFGINTFLFSSPFNNDSVKFFPKYKEWGFDTVEIVIEDVRHMDPVFIKEELDKNGLSCSTVCAAMSPDYDMRGTAKQQEDAHAYLRSIIDVTPAFGATKVAGPMYSTVGRADAVSESDYREQWKTVTGNLRQVADYAGNKGLKIAIEPLNRFETDFINTIDQCLNLIYDTGSEAMVIHYDTFHMNIEEKHQGDAIRKAGKYLGHFHACGCDRGTPGGDHINWQEIKTALTDIGYDGEISIESFTQDVKVIAKAAAIWRKIEPSQEGIAKNGVRFLKELFKS